MICGPQVSKNQSCVTWTPVLGTPDILPHPKFTGLVSVLGQCEYTISPPCITVIMVLNPPQLARRRRPLDRPTRTQTAKEALYTLETSI